ncbi:MAG TPA: triose-phosphate isomerase [Acidobacteriota bacterium]|nr:triose-phosphate isomerase [Acidobacteriota bacterium]HNT18523.1 triose-phosphate isomerase [Acidobacteriota bacterium]
MLKKLVAANWKMYKVQIDVSDFFGKWNRLETPKEEIAFFPQDPLIPLAKSLLRPGEKVGGQNCSERKEGAFTGDTSPYLLKNVGCEYVLIGHSERRHVFGEKNEVMGPKLKNAMEAGLRPVYCVGEKLEEREAGKTIEVVFAQLEALNGLSATGYDIAYEPVWAIGTGKVAKPEDASLVHGKIKEWLEEKGLGEDARVLYGGSVKPDNATELLSSSGIDGLLVGGASLDPESFHKIATAV